MKRSLAIERRERNEGERVRKRDDVCAERKNGSAYNVGRKERIGMREEE